MVAVRFNWCEISHPTLLLISDGSGSAILMVDYFFGIAGFCGGRGHSGLRRSRDRGNPLRCRGLNGVVVRTGKAAEV